MNYELSIPDIYNIPSKKLNDVDVDIRKYYFTPYETIIINLPKNTYFNIFFETENNKIYCNGDKIWNKKILFCTNAISSKYNLENMSNNAATLIIYVAKYNNKFKKITFFGWEGNNTHRKDKYEYITLCTIYCGISIITTIFLECNRELTEKIIQISSFNIICFYKKKLVSKNQTHDYELTLCGIKNTLSEEYVDIDLKQNNIYDVNDVYCRAFYKIMEFMENNVDYIINHNIKLPENICDPDLYKYNLFYNFNTLNFMKKYNIRSIDTYRYHKSN